MCWVPCVLLQSIDLLWTQWTNHLIQCQIKAGQKSIALIENLIKKNLKKRNLFLDVLDGTLSTAKAFSMVNRLYSSVKWENDGQCFANGISRLVRAYAFQVRDHASHFIVSEVKIQTAHVNLERAKGLMLESQKGTDQGAVQDDRLYGCSKIMWGLLLHLK